ncbi:type II toxin-antitoxin system death-on-curing family toxin [Geotalea sp. SG265]|uniref:type II toxin-antitoxin system death-on-curing family toxin n=1 Tax=Geotalea sp. SG265 TaxID=2922867 RepID=UPI001FB02528|nr:type II toxin-antitoxin system death-on-curing family toxin [Geotalea sp. SG265]
MINYLTAQQILFIHYRLIETTGGSHGVRDLGLLQAAAARPQATFDGGDLYPDIFAKAAALMESIIKNHPFVDGNKRTGITTAGLLLQFNGFRLQTTQDELYRFTMAMAAGEAGAKEVETWLRSRAIPL